MKAVVLEDNEKIEKNRRTNDIENARKVEIKAEKEILFNAIKMQFNIAKGEFS